MHEIMIKTSSMLSEPEQREYAQTIALWTAEAAHRGEPVLAQSAERLWEQFINHNSLVAFACGQLSGHITTYLLGEHNATHWYEVGSLIVPPEQRGMGLGNALSEAMAYQHPQAHLIATSKYPYAIRALSRAGFQVINYQTVPDVIRAPLCYDASCYVPTQPHTCRDEHNCGGYCFALARPPIQP
ncbi:MAG: GNAT family N-acetyltransferase [Candidatus Roizmanbacteria bacterium]|nr:GNAT family N-acetyltransferase [Candidatus Roizmanbacteria bacterium]